MRQQLVFNDSDVKQYEGILECVDEIVKNLNDFTETLSDDVDYTYFEYKVKCICNKIKNYLN